MAKVIILIGLVFIFIACSFNESSKTKAFNNTDNCSINNEEQLFLRSTLNDTLSDFIKTIGPILNPLNAPKFNSIIFCPGFHPYNPNDTLVIYLAQLIPYEIDELQKEYLFLKGGYKINEEYVLVYYEHFMNLSNIINEDLLDLKYAENVIANIPNDTTTKEWTYEAHEWVYKLSQDSLDIWRKLKFRYKGLDYILW